LLGGVDEKTAILQSLSSHFVESEIGEGAAFLSITNKPSSNSKAVIKGIVVDNSKMSETLFLEKFIQEMQLEKTTLDLILANSELGMQSNNIDYKKLIGDYPTITAFAVTVFSFPFRLYVTSTLSPLSSTESTVAFMKIVPVIFCLYEFIIWDAPRAR